MAAHGVLVDAVVTDPPYHLTSIVKRFGKVGSAPAKHGADGAAARLSKGFVGKVWDDGDIAFRPETWASVRDVMQPGARLLAFGGTRTWHRLTCAIEDSGLIIEDCIMWVFSQGLSLSKTRLKPAWQPIVMARKDGKVQKLNIEECRTEEGRYPADLIHDGQDEILRYFYCAKAGKTDRAGSSHATVKPLALMRYLCRLVTPPGGFVLDPFAGSGTTLQAAREEGFQAIGIEREDEYVRDIVRRLAA